MLTTRGAQGSSTMGDSGGVSSNTTGSVHGSASAIAPSGSGSASSSQLSPAKKVCVLVHAAALSTYAHRSLQKSGVTLGSLRLRGPAASAAAGREAIESPREEDTIAPEHDAPRRSIASVASADASGDDDTVTARQVRNRDVVRVRPVCFDLNVAAAIVAAPRAVFARSRGAVDSQIGRRVAHQCEGCVCHVATGAAHA